MAPKHLSQADGWFGCCEAQLSSEAGDTSTIVSVGNRVLWYHKGRTVF